MIPADFLGKCTLAQGTDAVGLKGYPPQLATDPVRVMRATLRGIRRNQLHVFPDAIAQIAQHLKRYTPGFLGWITAMSTGRLIQRANQPHS